MQISQLVTVRRRRWRIDDIRAYDGCQLVTLTGIAPPDLGVRRQVLAPFESIDPIDRPRRPRFVRPTLWRRACRALVAGETPPGGLRAARHARIDVMPHQLEPALAILRGRGSRVLLADDVGLGKTIQAAVAIAELRARGCADRVLVLTPAGLREQWAQELSGRFDIDAEIADASTLRTRRATLPIGVNPWAVARAAIASIDYVKRPEVLPAVAAHPWDVLVVDEAHGAAGDSDRRAAVGALASHAAYVLLLTATPHSGDHQSFVALSGLGALDAVDPVDNLPLLVFRRTRADIRLAASRRIHALHVRPNAAEARMHALLARYTSAIHAERDHAWLAAAVLHKRALSSAWSLAQSIERRLATLTRPERDDPVEQLALPLGDPDGELTADDEPPAWPSGLGLADAAREARLLRDLLAAARLAAHRESKLEAVRRILRRSREPAIVFTEYRDTLLHVQRRLALPAAVLHGGLTRDERAASLGDFSEGRKSVLLATDAAGEGLNLQTCRLVINLELPWNPMRLEQRIGRVDRIGQQRVVHAWHLIAADTGETRIFARLKDRIARARVDIGAPDPLGNDEERACARLVVLGSRDGEIGTDFRIKLSTTEDTEDAEKSCGEFASDAIGEAQRLSAARALTRHDDDAARLLVESSGPWIMRARRSAMRAMLGHRIVLVWTLAYDDACGRVAESTCVPALVTLSHLPPMRDRTWIDGMVRQIDRRIGRLVETSSAARRAAVERITEAFASTRLARERAIAARRARSVADVFQPGLFDRRAERAQLIAAVERQLADRDQTARVERLELSAVAVPSVPRLLLILVP